MSNGDPTHYEDLAALHVLGLLDEAGERDLLGAAERDPEVAALLRDFTEASAQIAFDAPQVTPPPSLRADVFAELPAPRAKSKAYWLALLAPYALAACLVLFLVLSGNKARWMVQKIRSQQDEISRLAASDSLEGMRLTTLDLKDPTYGTARVIVAWDSNRSRGLVSLENLPPAPAGKDYQLWALDPNAPAPVSAGIVRTARPFTVNALATNNPGFAVSLEPAGGSPQPTGPILFAVAPGS